MKQVYVCWGARVGWEEGMWTEKKCVSVVGGSREGGSSPLLDGPVRVHDKQGCLASCAHLDTQVVLMPQSQEDHSHLGSVEGAGSQGWACL